MKTPLLATTLVFAPPALALCFLFGFWLRWIPELGIGDAFGEFLMTLFLCELWSVPFAAFLAFATIRFFAGRIIWKRFGTRPFRVLGIALAYMPIVLCAMIPLFRYVGP